MDKCKAQSFIKISLVSLTQGDNNNNRVPVKFNYFMIKETCVNLFEVQSLHQLMFITIKYKKILFHKCYMPWKNHIQAEKRKNIKCLFLERCKKI